MSSQVQSALDAYKALRAKINDAKATVKDLNEELGDAHDELLGGDAHDELLGAMKETGVDEVELEDGKVLQIQEKLKEFKPRRRAAAE